MIFSTELTRKEKSAIKSKLQASLARRSHYLVVSMNKAAIRHIKGALRGNLFADLIAAGWMCEVKK